MNSWGKLAGVIFGALFGFVALVYLGGTMLDGRIDVGTEVHIDAPAAEVYDFVGTGPGVVRWWQGVGAQMSADSGYPPLDVAVVGEQTHGVGTVVRFSADGSVMENWTITAASPPDSVVWDVDFAGMMVVERTLSVRSDGSGCIVGWHETGFIDNPMFRYMTLAMPPEAVVANFDAALAGLKQQVESP